MAHWRMCKGKVRFTYQEAFAEASRQHSHFPHWEWNHYECFWCDFSHIGRNGVAPGHSQDCEAECARKSRHARELRIIEGIWSA